MSSLNRPAAFDMLHDDGLCHDHHWARDVGADRRRTYPRVADTARVSTPSSAMHDDIHYAS